MRAEACAPGAQTASPGPRCTELLLVGREPAREGLSRAALGGQGGGGREQAGAGAFKPPGAARRERLSGKSACPRPRRAGPSAPGACHAADLDRTSPRWPLQAAPWGLSDIQAGVLQAKSLDIQTGTIGVKPQAPEPGTAPLSRALIWGWWGLGKAKVSESEGCVGVGGAIQLLEFFLYAQQANSP